MFSLLLAAVAAINKNDTTITVKGMPPPPHNVRAVDTWLVLSYR